MFSLWVCALVVSLTWTQSQARTKCFPDFGCFDSGGDNFHLLYRPLLLWIPADREAINTTFIQYTKENPKVPQYVNSKKKESVTNSNFRADRPTKFIIHGFMDTQYFGKWMQHMKDELLKKEDCNVIIVDWSGGNFLPYAQAAVNTWVVAHEINALIRKLVEWKNVKVADIHMIGHSLGAHTAGYVGKNVTNIGRITGLDPAEPYFQYLPTSVRLDKHDAKFVDVIHTDGRTIFLLGFGMSQPCGDLDFYPNEGKNQPGCTKDRVTKFVTDGLTVGMRNFAACNHQRAIDFFIVIINNDQCNYVGYKCSSWQSYLNAECTECGRDGKGCALMGPKADQYAPLIKKNEDSVIMYLTTLSKEPYCAYAYHVRVHLHKGSGKYSDQKGKFKIAIKGAYDSLTETLSEDTYKHGEQYDFLLTSATDVGSPTGLTFTFEAGINIFKTQEVYVDKIEVESMIFIDKKTRDERSKAFCHKATQAIPKNKETTFNTC